jgi:hypothetical protein
MKYILYWFSKIFFYCFTIWSIFFVICCSLGFFEFYLGWDIPFVEISMLKGKEMISVVAPDIEISMIFQPRAIIMIAIFPFFSFYFYLMHRFFKVFIADSIFHEKAIRDLCRFFYLNLAALLIAFIAAIASTISRGYFKIEESVMFIIIHGFVSIISYLYIDMAKKGADLKQENDLTI